MPSRIVRCRLPCELTGEGHTDRGIAVNVSEQGLFIQTRASYAVGTRLRVRLLETPDQPEVALAARVARAKKVHPAAQVVVARGMGLEVLEAGPEWGELTTRLGCRTAERAEAPAGDPTFGLPSFRIVLRRKDGIRIRTRVVRVACVDAAAARDGVVADVEEGWEIVRLERESIEGAAAAAAGRFRVVALREGGARRWECSFEAASAEDARRCAVADLGEAWRIEAVEPAAAQPDDDAGADAPGGVGDERGSYQVKARCQDGESVRTRIARVVASSPEEAAARVVEHLGEAWQAVKVTPL